VIAAPGEPDGVSEDPGQLAGPAPSVPESDKAWRELLAALYVDLRSLAQGYLKRERPDHTLQPTALVHEVYLLLQRRHDTAWVDRDGMLAACSQAMRRILVDHERARRRLKRGGDRHRTSLESAETPASTAAVDLPALDEALTRLAAIDPIRATIVELRFFGGLTAGETALHLGLSEPTVNRYWNLARAWLYRELNADD
jgi:RNA polymerase sigma factor (TIGR02999 family)